MQQTADEVTSYEKNEGEDHFQRLKTFSPCEVSVTPVN